jgi:transcriptional regulator with XRE-family HTH domain
MKRDKTIHNKQYSDLVEKLYLERKSLSLSQTEVGNHLNMTQSEISKIETGDRRMDILEFKEILKVYRVSENTKLNQLVIDFLGLKQ